MGGIASLLLGLDNEIEVFDVCIYSCVTMHIKKCIYLFESHKRSDRGGEIFHSQVHSPNAPNSGSAPDHSQEIRALSRPPMLMSGSQVICYLRCISRKLDLKWRQDLIPGSPKWDMDISFGTLTLCAITSAPVLNIVSLKARGSWEFQKARGQWSWMFWEGFQEGKLSSNQAWSPAQEFLRVMTLFNSGRKGWWRQNSYLPVHCGLLRRGLVFSCRNRGIKLKTLKE